MRVMLEVVGLAVCAYALVWGVTWLGADLSWGVSGTSPNGEPFSYYPGAFLGGLAPTPSPVSQAPQALAAIGGATGFVAITWRLFRERRHKIGLPR